jgi:oxygen-independent coproporphyrinogen-3 oxidase
MTGLYIHIPFCHAKCHYCDFAAYPGRAKEIPRYLAALAREIRTHHGKTLETLFVGGGTPSVLEPAQWKDLWGVVTETFLIKPGFEATVECNPESSSPEKLAALRELGINRLSFGLQASQDELLQRLGRLHDFARFRQVFHEARKAGFDNLNVDLMYGLPGQTLTHWQETLEKVFKLSPEHISAYALTVEEETVFARRRVETDDDLQADMYERAADLLTSAGYVHYEISNFARPGRECRHNLRYWRNLPCLGVGVSAAGYEDGVRRKNTEDIGGYIAAMEQGRSAVVEEERLSETERVGEDLMLSLRLKEGAEPAPLARELYGDVLERFRSLGFINQDPRSLRWIPTRMGWRLSNQLFSELLSPPPRTPDTLQSR